MFFKCPIRIVERSHTFLHALEKPTAEKKLLITEFMEGSGGDPDEPKTKPQSW